MSETRERVERGAEYLDSEYPGWYRYVDRETLDIGSSFHCILAQLNGGEFESSPEYGFEDFQWIVDHGFLVYAPGSAYDTIAEKLTDGWHRAITNRATPY